MKRRDKTEVLRDRLQLEDTRLLFQIDEAIVQLEIKKNKKNHK